MTPKQTTADLAAQDAAILAAFHEFERANPDGSSICETAEKLGGTIDRVMDALEREAAKNDARKITLPMAGIGPETILKKGVLDALKAARKYALAAGQDCQPTFDQKRGVDPNFDAACDLADQLHAAIGALEN